MMVFEYSSRKEKFGALASYGTSVALFVTAAVLLGYDKADARLITLTGVSAVASGLIGHLIDSVSRVDLRKYFQ